MTARSDYGIRAMIGLAACGSSVTADTLAEQEDLPAKYLGAILSDLRRCGLVTSQRGVGGGYGLARPASAITVADVLRALEGPLVDVHGARPEDVDYNGSAQDLKQVWVATRASIREVLERVTMGDLAAGRIPQSVKRRTADPSAWVTRVAG